MKRLSISIQMLAITLIVVTCRARIVPQTNPTIDPAELQSTAVSAALTIVAETQAAAIPTASPVTPTSTLTATPVPTNTFIPLPTQGDVSTPNPGGSSDSLDPCINKLLPDKLTGNPIKIRVDNPTKGTINLSIYLQSGNPQGVCGYRAYVLEPQDSLVITNLVEGCYSLWAWNPDPKDYFMVTNGTSCLNASQNGTFDIVPNGSIKLRE